MPIDAILFNLDGTIVDSAALDVLREEGHWQECVANITATRCFPYVERVLTRLRENRIRVGVVTSSVTFYAERMLRHHAIPCDALIAYHDARPHKPHPAPVAACLRRLSVAPERAIGVGDSVEDCEAYVAAGVTSLGAGWNENLIRTANWHGIVATPAHLLDYLYL